MATCNERTSERSTIKAEGRKNFSKEITRVPHKYQSCERGQGQSYKGSTKKKITYSRPRKVKEGQRGHIGKRLPPPRKKKIKTTVYQRNTPRPKPLERRRLQSPRANQHPGNQPWPEVTKTPPAIQEAVKIRLF